MFKKMTERFGLVGESFDERVEKEMQSPLTQLYLKLSLSPEKDKVSFLDEMDGYVQFSRLHTANSQEFDELETTLELDIFRLMNQRPYTEGDTLVNAKQALKDYKSLPDAKRALFRKSLIKVSHKNRTPTPVSRLKTRA